MRVTGFVTRDTDNLLAGNRWHIDCFRCNTCNTLLDSDANLLLLGDGSLICNNCTYSCSACGNKIEDLAILTGDQAFCASCFRCRNCKKKIENLRYARTSQGIFCMECHEGLMARRRKKSAKNSVSRQKQVQNNTMLLDKSLPSLPPSIVPQSAFSPDYETPPSDNHSDTPTELPPSARRPSYQNGDASRDRSQSASEEERKGETGLYSSLKVRLYLLLVGNLLLPSTTYRTNRKSYQSNVSGTGDDFIPMALDLHSAPGPSPMIRQQQPQFELEDTSLTPHGTESTLTSRDYFTPKNPRSTSKKLSYPLDASKRSTPSNSKPGSRRNSVPSSPHIAFQEKGRLPSSETHNIAQRGIESGVNNGAERTTPNGRHDDLPQKSPGDHERFRLQEVPKHKRSGSSKNNSKQDLPNNGNSVHEPRKAFTAPVTTNNHISEQQIMTSASSPTSTRSNDMSGPSPRNSLDARYQESSTKESPNFQISPLSTALHNVPLRGDSLQRSHATQIPVSQAEPSRSKLSIASISKAAAQGLSSASLQLTKTQESPSNQAPVNSNGAWTIPIPVESPNSRSSLDVQPPMRAKERPTFPSASNSESFVSPRAPPHPPMEPYHKTRNESISTMQSEASRNGDNQPSPGILSHTGTGEFSGDEDLARILSGDDQERASFLRRVSNSVRHARSYSDRGTRLTKEPKWPKSPLNGAGTANVPQDISSPTTSSPEAREELAWFKNELRKERQKIVEKNQRISELETALNGKSAIKQMNNELKEKRSTMIVLDTQKEMVVRELEILTEHIAAAKQSKEPLDLRHLNNVVLLEFAQALEKLKQSFTPQIEQLIQTKTDLIEEVAGLGNLKDQSLQEFEQLSRKNAQLADLNNQLVHQIQGLYKANAVPSPDAVRQPPHGLGIYTHHLKDKSSHSIDSRDLQPSISNSVYSGSTAVLDQEPEPASVLNAPQVVNIRKGGQPKKFNWRRGGQSIAKVSKGVKGAFTANDTGKTQREGSFTETVPYGALQPHEQPITVLPGRLQQPNDYSQPGFGFFNNNNQKLQRPGIPPRAFSNGAPSALLAENPAGKDLSFPLGLIVSMLMESIVLYGSELELRAEFEGVRIPGIITRCVQEVEARGKIYYHHHNIISFLPRSA